MWTPKRVLLLALGFALLFAVYLIYAHFLGGVDGLPPLPEVFFPSQTSGLVSVPIRPNIVDERLIMAFGPACRELSRPIKLEVHSKGVVFSTDAIVIQHGGDRDGQVKMEPLSLAVFSKNTPPGQYPEITTVQAKTAYLSFDRPISTMNDLAKAKIVGADLYEKILVVNNRRKPRGSEELVVWVPNGPVHYRQQPRPVSGRPRRPDIQTDDFMQLTDNQSKPKPTQINAHGLDLYLTSESETPAPGPTAGRKARGDTISGVERIVLRSDVEMILYTDPQSGFMATNNKSKNAGPAAARPTTPRAAEKPQVNVKTPGPFTYDMAQDYAVFEAPSVQSRLFPDTVHVTRFAQPQSRPDLSDVLDCDRLELQFRRKKTAEGQTPAGGDDRSVNLEIQTAHATGKQVVLYSDAELLHILEANDFHYDAIKRETKIKGPQHILVSKEGHDLEARELHIVEQQGTQRMTAFGPGVIKLFDKAAKEQSNTATWKDQLTTSKDGEQDLLVLTGQATFQDTEHQQFLSADKLRVWIEPGSANPTQPPATAGNGPHGRRPQRVEATGHVVTRSPEMTIHDTDTLVLTFKDAPPRGRLPTQLPTAPTVPVPPMTAPSAPPVPGTASDSPKQARPIDLSAHLVEARLLRADGGKNELERLWTEGQVKVHQAPEKSDEKGLDIKGDTLELTKQPEGNRLVVTSTDVAELQIDKLFIRGPQIEVDQAENEAWVRGGGALTMRNNTTFNGNKLDHEVDLTIYWNEYMHFQGAHAHFTGDIQAEQENAQLTCQSLQVELDRPVSFREGERKGPQAKVDRMVCDRKVCVEDSEFQNGRRIKYQRIECRELVVHNGEGQAQAAGPGEVRIHQPGDAGPELAPTPNQPAKSSKDQEMKLTIVQFAGRMRTDNAKHLASFYDDIKVIHLATDDKGLKPDPDRLPHDAIYLECWDQLRVHNRPENGKSNQELEAVGRVKCYTEKYIAECEKLNYNESKDQLIFDGLDGWARMKQFGALGGQAQESQAKRFIYLRKTGEISSIGARGINGRAP